VTSVVMGGLAWAAYFGAFGWYAATRRGGEPISGAVMGVLGGPMGVILAALLPAPARVEAAEKAVPPPVPRRARVALREVAE
jgi:hypothetical protein